jgi:positive control factor
MISDLQYAIEWMKTCKRPGNRRGVERLAAYQREKPVDSLHMQRYIEHVGVDKYPWIDREQRDTVTLMEQEMIEDALSVLTKREREAYLMVRGNCFSFGEAAKLRKVTKSRVQGVVKRAEIKISPKISAIQQQKKPA